MAAAFARAVGPDGEVWAVDVHEDQQTRKGFRFVLVGGAELPFDESSFDFVVSNHVMEHVGGPEDQLTHLREIRRVLRPEGIAYISVPNKWRIVDRHFHLPFVSWLPRPVADRYVRWTRRGAWYDVDPPSRGRMRRLLTQATLEWEDCTLEAMRVMAETEGTGALQRRVLTAPAPVLRPGMAMVPSMIFIARRR
jgi:SAM-dependent methyltransferase